VEFELLFIVTGLFALLSGLAAALTLIRSARMRRREQEILRHKQRVARMKRKRRMMAAQSGPRKESAQRAPQPKEYLTAYLTIPEKRRDGGRRAV